MLDYVGQKEKFNLSFKNGPQQKCLDKAPNNLYEGGHFDFQIVKEPIIEDVKESLFLHIEDST